jgi:stage II sporulation protein AA (anti-sigma F factor antagonist)
MLQFVSPAAIDIEQRGGVCVLRCKGSLVAGRGHDYIRGKLGEIEQLNYRNVVADLREVPSIGSPGIAFIAGVYRFVVKKSGGRFIVAGAAPLVRRALEITGLSKMIPLAADLQTGLETLRAEESAKAAATS